MSHRIVKANHPWKNYPKVAEEVKLKRKLEHIADGYVCEVRAEARMAADKLNKRPKRFL